MASRQLMLEIGANVARLRSDMNKSAGVIKKFTTDTRRMFLTVGATIAAIFAARVIGAGVRALKRELSDIVKLAGEQELAEKKLATALGFTSQALLDHASALQKVTTFGDEAIIDAIALTAAFTKNEASAKKAAEATLDLAAGALRGNLKSAADLVSKTLGSTTNALSRYGIVVEGAVGSTERLESFVRNVNKVFGGQARAEAETYAGKVKQVSNAWGDMKEELGKVITENRLVVESLNLIKETVESFGTVIKDNKDVLRDWVKTGLLFGTDAMLLFVKTITKLTETPGVLREAWLRFRLGTGALGSDMKTLTAELEKVAKANRDAWRVTDTLIFKLEELRRKMAELESGEAVKPPTRSILGTEGVEKTKSEISASIKAAEGMVDSYDDYYGILEARTGEWLTHYAGVLETERDMRQKAAEELIYSADDYYGPLQDRSIETIKIFEDANQKIKDDAAEAGREMAEAWTKPFLRIGDTLTDFVVKGKASFRDLVDSIIHDMVRIAIQAAITPIIGAFTNFLTPRYTFGGARQSGGPVYPGSSYLVGERGPELFSPATAGSIIPSAGINVKVNVINQTSQQVRPEQSPPRINAEGWVIDVVLKGLENNTHGLRYALGG
jgi:hypothetical protein